MLITNLARSSPDADILGSADPRLCLVRPPTAKAQQSADSSRGGEGDTWEQGKESGSKRRESTPRPVTNNSDRGKGHSPGHAEDGVWTTSQSTDTAPSQDRAGSNTMTQILTNMATRHMRC